MDLEALKGEHVESGTEEGLIFSQTSGRGSCLVGQVDDVIFSQTSTGASCFVR